MATRKNKVATRQGKNMYYGSVHPIDLSAGQYATCD